MDMKKLVIGTLAAAVALLVVGYVVDMIPFIGGGDAGFGTGDIVGAIAHGVVLVVVLGWRGVGDAMDGLKGGATFGALMSLAGSVAAMSFDGALIGGAIGAAVVTGAAGAAIAMAGGGGSD